MHLPATTPPVPVRRLLGALLALTTGLGVFFAVHPPARAAAAAHYPAAAVGNDISFPQCGHDYPDHAAFGIAGVTGGRAFTGNPCFASEYHWAREAGSPASVYFNINYARPGYLTFATHALDGPAGRCAPTQNPCTAYNYGWNAAADAVDRGDAAGADPAMWWLDVETVNYWADPPDRALNARVSVPRGEEVTVAKTYKMYIGGEMTDAKDGNTRTITSPATGEELGVVPESSAVDVDRAVEAAKRAFEETWSDATPKERMESLLASMRGDALDAGAVAAGGAVEADKSVEAGGTEIRTEPNAAPRESGDDEQPG